MNAKFSQPGVHVEAAPNPGQTIRGLSSLRADSLIELRAIATQARKSRAGCRNLFSGLTQKTATLAIQWLARELQVDIFRIDLTAVANKYIGETEKNLRRVFAAAAKAGAILFFDEADALFGKRSEVKDSHDRYANVELSFLLQQLQKYTGLCIVASNGKKKLKPELLQKFEFHYPPTPVTPSQRSKPGRR